MKKPSEVSTKNTKDQILAAYHEALSKLHEKQTNPQEVKTQEKKEEIVVKAASHSPDAILSDLSALKLKSLKQLDVVSEELLEEFQKLSDIRQAIAFEQKHLEDLYQINETANTLTVLIQTQREQKENFEKEVDLQKKEFEQSMSEKRACWKEENDYLENQFKESKERLEKERKRDAEEYAYALDVRRRKELDDYAVQKASLEKELFTMKESLEKRETTIKEREQSVLDLEARVLKFPEELKQAVLAAEEKVRGKLSQEHSFEMQLKEKDYSSVTKLQEQRIASLQEKVKEQEVLFKEMSQKVDQSAQQVQLIACRALDASRFVIASSSHQEEKLQPK